MGFHDRGHLRERHRHRRIARLALARRHLGMLLAAAASLTVVYQLAFMGATRVSRHCAPRSRSGPADAVGLMAMPHTRGLPLAATCAHRAQLGDDDHRLRRRPHLDEPRHRRARPPPRRDQRRRHHVRGDRQGERPGARRSRRSPPCSPARDARRRAPARRVRRLPAPSPSPATSFRSPLIAPPWRRWVRVALQRVRVKSTTAEDPSSSSRRRQSRARSVSSRACFAQCEPSAR